MVSFDYLSNEVVSYIFNEFTESFKDFKNYRLINKRFYEILMTIWRKYKINDLKLSPRRTFVSISHCYNCKKIIENNKRIELLLDYFSHPKPVYISCNSWKCIHNCVIDSFYNAWKVQNVIYLNYNNLLPVKSLIPRSNNKKTIANIDNNYVKFHENKLLAYVYWYENGLAFQKSVNVNSIKKTNIQFSSWYKSYNDMNFEEIADILKKN
jgi:hypothetical protein